MTIFVILMLNLSYPNRKDKEIGRQGDGERFKTIFLLSISKDSG